MRLLGGMARLRHKLRHARAAGGAISGGGLNFCRVLGGVIKHDREGSFTLTCVGRASGGASATAPTTAAAGSMGKRTISERPTEVAARERVGHCEADTVMGIGCKDCDVILVERKTGLVLIGNLADRTAGSLSRLIRHSGGHVETVTADNGTEFHGCEGIKRCTGVIFYFARSYH